MYTDKEAADNTAKPTVFTRVSETFYQARELSDEICQIADMLLGPPPPINTTAEQKASQPRPDGILYDLDDASDGTRRLMERAFGAIKRIRAAL